MTLPEGWAEAKLIDIADFVMGQAPPGADCNFEGRGTPFVKAGEFGPTRPIIREWTTKPLKLASADDVLICVVGATSGKLNLGADCAIGRSVAAIRPSEASSADFLYSRLRSEVIRLRTASTGTAQGVISREMLAAIDIALPPAAEQRRIVAKLDALTARLARARSELDRVPVLAKQLREQASAAVFGIADAPTMPLRELVSDVRYGTAKKCDYAEGATPVLRIPNVQSGRIDLSDLKAADFDAREREKLALKLGDVLVIRSNGSLDLVGRSAVVSEPAVGMLYAGYLIRLRPDLRRAIPDYIQRFLSSSAARRAIIGDARSTSGVNNVNAQQLQALRVPALSLDQQQAAVEAVDAIVARADRLEAEAARARALLGRMEAAILARAFRGELVPQDPADEPASVLLDRIRANRAAAPNGRGRRAGVAEEEREKKGRRG